MAWRAATVLTVLSLAAPAAHAEQPATTIRASVGNVRFDRQPSPPRALRSQRASASRRTVNNDSAVVAGLAVAGLYGGMLVASRVALPCHCDDPESVVARGGMIGGIAGAIVGIVITSR